MISESAGSVCPVCSSFRFRSLFQATDRLYRTTEKLFQVVECRQCSLLRLHPSPSPHELRTFYPSNYWFAPGNSTASRLEELYRRVVLRDHVSFVHSSLASHVPGPVLDIGCGGGLFGRLMRERGHICLGLDFSQQAATVGWSVNAVPVVVGDFTQSPFAPASFKAVTMFHVLEHLYNPVECLESVYTMLRPGGSLIVQVPNASSWQFLLFGASWNGIDVPRHLVNYRASDLHRLLLRCGFEVVRKKYFSLRDNPAGLASTLAPALDPMARRIGRSGEEKGRLLKDLLYLALVAASVPLTALEAACSAGSTVMIQARKA